MEVTNVNGIILHTEPELAAKEYMDHVYGPGISAAQQQEVTRAFAAGMLQSNIILLCAENLIEHGDQTLADKILAALLHDVTTFGGSACASQNVSQNSPIKMDLFNRHRNLNSRN